MNLFRSLLPLALLSAAVAAHADLTSLNDNFESESGSGLNYASFNNWTVTDGSVDLLDFSLGQGLNVDLDGSSNKSGLFSTTEAFAPGTYLLSFDLAGSQRGDDNTVLVNFGSYSNSILKHSADGFQTETAIVTLTSSAHLSFENPGDDNVGALLDNVKVQAVPEPTSMAALGLGALALLKRRRK